MMNFFQHTAEQWSSFVLNTGVQAAFVAILAFVFLLLTRRFISAPLRYAILLVVLVKFAIPPNLELQTGLFTKYSVIRNTVISTGPAIVIDTTTTRSKVVSDANHSRILFFPDTKMTGVPTPQSAPAPSSIPVVSQPGPEFHWSYLLLPLYLLGTAVFVGLLIHRYRCVRRIVRASTLQQDGFLFSEVARISELLQMKSPPALRISDETDAPFAIGAFRPVIVMPRAIAEELQPDQLTIVIAHELAHIRRRDLLIGWFETLVSLVWWFHPALWWLRKSLRRTREDCCDDLLLAKQLAEPERYCETLIEAASRQSTRLTEPLVLGFVHQEHPAARRIRRLMNSTLFRADRLRYPALIFTLLFALIMLPGLRPDQQPVTETTLEGDYGWRNLPFRIDAGEETAIKECKELAQTYFFTRNDIRDFSLPETRDKLEAILEAHPKLFYAQNLLGTWHRMNGNLEEASRLLNESLANAPVVLTQTYKRGNGDPIQDVAIDQLEIECNRVQKGSLDPSLRLKFVALITDSQGQVHLPVYDTVYRTSSQSYPVDYFAEFQNLGWIESNARNGILPDVMVWKPWSRPRDFTRTASQTPRLKNATGTDTLQLISDSNAYSIGRVARGQADGRVRTEDGKGMGIAVKGSSLKITNGTFMDHALIELAGPAPSRFALSQVDVLDSQTKIPLQSFQYGAGFTWTDQSRFHLFSLWEKLPDKVDLVLKVINYDSDDFRYQIPAAIGSTVQHAGSSFAITYLGAGNHNGWSSNSGFHGEAQGLENTSEIIFQITGNREQKFSLWVVSKTGRRQNLNEDGWFSSQTGNSPIRIMLPLSEIAHFELVPYVEPKTIYFEQIQLPARSAPLNQELPLIEFPVDGQARKYTSDAFNPLRVHFESHRGNLYSGMGSYNNSFEFHERPLKDQFPKSKMTVSWYYHATIDLKHRLEFVVAPPPVKPGRSRSQSSSAIWGDAGFSSRETTLESVKAVILEILPKPDGE